MEKLHQTIKRNPKESSILTENQVKLKQELLDLKEKYEVLFNNATSGIAYHKIVYSSDNQPINYIITDVNPQYEAILHIKKADVVNKTATEAYNVKRPPYLEIYSKVAETQKSQSLEAYFEPMDMYFKISVISQRKGEFITVFDDITEQKKSNQRLKESEEKFRTIAEQSFMGIMIVQDAELKYLNKAMSLITGYPVEEMLTWTDKNYIRMIHPEDLDYILVRIRSNKDATMGPFSHNSFRIVNKDGEIRWLEDYTSKIIYQGRPANLISIIDATDKKEAERLILEENKTLIELNKMRKDIITRVSHELKTPLTSIYGASQILLKHLSPQIGEEALNFIEIFHRGALRLKKLVENLIDASRIEYGKLELNIRPHDLVPIIKECIEEMSYLLENRNQLLVSTMPKKMDVSVDKIRIQQVVTNLLSNAIKNTPVNGNIYIDLIHNFKYYDIRIRDTGIGLTEKEKELLFQKFGKIERYGMDLGVDIEGSGIGLYISKEIVELHGGQIIVKSEGRNQGASFTVRLFKNI
ncbi:MAG: ATP-binding protein [Candidatus Thorarchaeota archaeon]